MRRFIAIAALCLATSATAAPRLGDTPKVIERLNGSPQYQESISATTSSGTQSTAFKGGETLLIQPSADVLCAAKTSSAGTVTTSNSVKILADEKFYLTLKSNETHVACITASGTSTVKLFVME